MLSYEACSNLTDEELVNMTIENEDYYLYLMRRYESKLKYYIIRISGLDPEDAEDLLQEVFIKVYRNLNDFNKDLKFASWIYRITRNHAISNYRSKKLQETQMLDELDENKVRIWLNDFDISEKIDRDLTRKNIYQILDTMDQKYKEVLVLRYFEERDYNEISDILKKPIGTVATLLYRAKKKFKENMINFKIKL